MRVLNREKNPDFLLFLQSFHRFWMHDHTHESPHSEGGAKAY